MKGLPLDYDSFCSESDMFLRTKLKQSCGKLINEVETNEVESEVGKNIYSLCQEISFSSVTRNPFLIHHHSLYIIGCDKPNYTAAASTE